MRPTILAVHSNPLHTFSKHPQPSLHLLAGLGVKGDAHSGATVQHRYLARRNPAMPNRMQVHLLAAEFLNALAAEFPAHSTIASGALGENITTRHLNLLTLPLATRLHLGATAVLELTGLRSPCRQMNTLRPGLMQAAFIPGTRGPRAGVMAIVLAGGTVTPGDLIQVDLPSIPHHPLCPL